MLLATNILMLAYKFNKGNTCIKHYKSLAKRPNSISLKNVIHEVDPLASIFVRTSLFQNHKHCGSKTISNAKQYPKNAMD